MREQPRGTSRIAMFLPGVSSSTKLRRTTKTDSVTTEVFSRAVHTLSLAVGLRSRAETGQAVDSTEVQAEQHRGHHHHRHPRPGSHVGGPGETGDLYSGAVEADGDREDAGGPMYHQGRLSVTEISQRIKLHH